MVPPPPTAATATRGQQESFPREPSSTIDSSSQTETNGELGKAAGYEQIIEHYYSTVPKQRARNYENENLRASFPDVHWEPLKEVTLPEDRAHFADPEYKELFAAATKVEHITPIFGTILHGVNLGKLNDKQKDELARLVSFRGAVFFREQDDVGVDELLKLGRHYGPLHVNGATPVPRGSVENEELYNLHVVDASEQRKLGSVLRTLSQTDQWHSDVSFEIQPASYTFLKLFEVPPVGGDTLWNSGYGTYDEVSRPLAEYLEKLTASHSSQRQTETVRKLGFTTRRDALTTSHPVVRTHPVTGWKSVFVNPGFTDKIDNVTRQESTLILNHLYNIIAASVQDTVRWKWNKNDIAVWDNRTTTHAASFGTYPHFRHGIRVTVTGEKPYLDGGVSQRDDFAEKLKHLSID